MVGLDDFHAMSSLVQSDTALRISELLLFLSPYFLNEIFDIVTSTPTSN